MRARSSSDEDTNVTQINPGKRNRSANDRSGKYKRKQKAILNKQKYRETISNESSNETASRERYERSKEKRREQENQNPNSKSLIDRQ